MVPDWVGSRGGKGLPERSHNGAGGGCLTAEAFPPSLEEGSLAREWAHQKPGTLGKLIGYFEKVPG